MRFHNAADEKVIGRNVVTPVCDDIQLSVDEYRTKLYDVSIFFYIAESVWFHAENDELYDHLLYLFYIDVAGKGRFFNRQSN